MQHGFVKRPAGNKRGPAKSARYDPREYTTHMTRTEFLRLAAGAAAGLVLPAEVFAQDLGLRVFDADKLTPHIASEYDAIANEAQLCGASTGHAENSRSHTGSQHKAAENGRPRSRVRSSESSSQNLAGRDMRTAPKKEGIRGMPGSPGPLRSAACPDPS